MTYVANVDRRGKKKKNPPTTYSVSGHLWLVIGWSQKISGSNSEEAKWIQ
jgi:hypothetical protein